MSAPAGSSEQNPRHIRAARAQTSNLRVEDIRGAKARVNALKTGERLVHQVLVRPGELIVSCRHVVGDINDAVVTGLTQVRELNDAGYF